MDFEENYDGVNVPKVPGPGVQKGLGILVLVAVVLVLGVILHPWAIIGAGERGVLLEWGAVQPGTYDEGWHWKIPIMQEYIKMDVKTQKLEQGASSASKDLQDVTTTVVVNYHLQPDKVDIIYQTLRRDYESRVIIPAIQESVKAVTARFNAEELITERPTVKRQIKEILAEKLLEYNIILEDISITNFQFSEAYTRAIEDKQVAEQKALEAQRILERKKIEAEQMVVMAEAQKKATILEAEGRAKALELQKGEITPELNKFKAIEKWDGRMPMYVGSGIIPFIELDTTKAPTSPPPGNLT